VIAATNPGYWFVNWTTNGVPASSSARYIFTVKGDILLVANFSPLTHTVTTSGPISGSETWSGTVFLTGDVTITPTGSLTILPGTLVECDPRADDQIGGLNTSRIELIVNQGKLNAVGTAASPIIFTAAWLLRTNPPVAGDWYGIRIHSTNAVLRYCTVQVGTVGMSVEGGACTVDYCTFSSNKIYGAIFSVSGAMADCVVSQNGAGVQAADSQLLTITNCTISDNSGAGIYSHPDRGADIAIVNSIICGNNNSEYGAVCATAVDLSRSSVVNNAGSGLWFRTGTITASDMIGNGGVGVFAFGPGTSVIQGLAWEITGLPRMILAA
jgi:hypothetical protein